MRGGFSRKREYPPLSRIKDTHLDLRSTSCRRSESTSLKSARNFPEREEASAPLSHHSAPSAPSECAPALLPNSNNHPNPHWILRGPTCVRQSASSTDLASAPPNHTAVWSPRVSLATQALQPRNECATALGFANNLVPGAVYASPRNLVHQ